MLVDNNQVTNIAGKVIINADGSTNIPGVFSGGDCVNGGKEVVDAVQAGKEGARGIMQWLMINC